MRQITAGEHGVIVTPQLDDGFAADLDGGPAAGGVPAPRRGEAVGPSGLKTSSDAESEAQMWGLLAAGTAAETNDQETGA